MKKNTKKSKGKGSTNYSLEKSPLNDGAHSFMRRQGYVRPKREYKNERRGTMTKKDFAQATIYGNRAREKYMKDNKKRNDVPNAKKHKP